MQKSIFFHQAPRLNRAVAMIETADTLVRANNPDSALLLYVTALEIVGEALITHNQLSHLMAGGVRKHQARHFLAATLLPGLLFSNAASPILQSLDFAKVRYVPTRETRDGKEVTVWGAEGVVGPALDLLRGLHESMDRSAWPEELRRTSALLSYWRDTAFGHWDNYRLALIHQDNTFGFLEFDHSGRVQREQVLPVGAIASTFVEISREILNGLRDQQAMDFFTTHAASLFEAFRRPLRTNSYE